MFFSDEKNQKTFVSPAAPGYGIWPDGGACTENKSLLLLFFRKEGLAPVHFSFGRGAPTIQHFVVESELSTTFCTLPVEAGSQMRLG
jgi:hypothetical protein